MESEQSETAAPALHRGARTAFTGTTVMDRQTRNALFEVLSNERRRCALYYLQQQSEPIDLTDVVDYVAAWEYGEPVSKLDSNDRMCVYSALHQVHLPKLDATGFIEYDDDEGQIRVRERIDYARLYLEYDPGNDITWSTCYLGLVATATVLGVVHQLNVTPFELGSNMALVWLLVAMFGLSALVHALHEWHNKRALDEIFEVDR